jgi:hypothetical protein
MRVVNLLVIIGVLGATGCGTKNDPSDVSLSTTELACPSDTLTLTIDGGFPSDTMVGFQMGGTFLDGDAVVLNDGSIACGLPSNAAPGTYEVIIDGKSVGMVKLDASNC